ncbi:hypothetical protein [Streptomyces sp. E-08]
MSGFLLLAGLGVENLTAGVVGLALMSLALVLKGIRFLRFRRHA